MSAFCFQPVFRPMMMVLVLFLRAYVVEVLGLEHQIVERLIDRVNRLDLHLEDPGHKFLRSVCLSWPDGAAPHRSVPKYSSSSGCLPPVPVLLFFEEHMCYTFHMGEYEKKTATEI